MTELVFWQDLARCAGKRFPFFVVSVITICQRFSFQFHSRDLLSVKIKRSSASFSLDLLSSDANYTYQIMLPTDYRSVSVWHSSRKWFVSLTDFLAFNRRVKTFVTHLSDKVKYCQFTEHDHPRRPFSLLGNASSAMRFYGMFFEYDDINQIKEFTTNRSKIEAIMIAWSRTSLFLFCRQPRRGPPLICYVRRNQDY